MKQREYKVLTPTSGPASSSLYLLLDFGVLRHEPLLHDIIKGTMRGKDKRGRRKRHPPSDLMKGKYVALKKTAEDRKEWQNC